MAGGEGEQETRLNGISSVFDLFSLSPEVAEDARAQLLGFEGDTMARIEPIRARLEQVIRLQQTLPLCLLRLRRGPQTRVFRVCRVRMGIRTARLRMRLFLHPEHR